MTTTEPGLAAFALTAKPEKYLNLRGVTSDDDNVKNLSHF